MLKLPSDVSAEIKRQVALVIPKITEIRRDLHRHPERSKREQRTSDLVASHISDLGYEVTRGSSVYSLNAVLSGQKKGKTVALRGDMDALKLQEQTGLPFASEVEEVMHACGHDAHTAILLGVAEILSKMSHVIPGKVKFLFQPSEEAFPGGALPMIDEGVLEKPKVDAAFALHVDSTLPTGYIAISPGAIIGGVTAVNIRVQGIGGHFAKPYQAVDPIVIAAHVITGLQSMVARQVDFWKPFVLTFGQVLGGTRDNIIPEDVIIRGDMGALDNKLLEEVETKIERLVKGTTESYGATGEVSFWRGYPTLENDFGMAKLVEEVAADIIGEDKLVTQSPDMGGEDFAFFAQKVPAAMWRLGAWDKSKYEVPTRHHDPKFDMDEACMPLGVELMANMALEYLSRNTD